MANIQKIATVHSDFPEKFGIPRQSGIIGGTESGDSLRTAFPRSELCAGA